MIKSFQKRSILLTLVLMLFMFLLLIAQLVRIMIINPEVYSVRAQELHERERSIKAERGIIYDRNNIIIADNKPVSTISVIHNQITDAELVIEELSQALGLSEEAVRKRVEKVSSIERIKSNVDKDTADYIYSLELDGVMVDEQLHLSMARLSLQILFIARATK